MVGKTYKTFNFWNCTIFVFLTFLCGSVVGGIAISFLQIMKVANFILWIKIPQAFFYVSIFGVEINLYYVFLCVAVCLLVMLAI